VTLHPERGEFRGYRRGAHACAQGPHPAIPAQIPCHKGRLITQGGGGAGRGIACRNHRLQRRLLPRRRKGRRRFLFRRPASKASIEIRRYLSQSIAARKPVGYDRQFLLPAECHVLSFRGTACPPCEGRDAEFRRSGGRHVCKTDSEPSQLKLPSTGEVAYSAGTPRPCRRRPAAN
jgi:hypothetical protein